MEGRPALEGETVVVCPTVAARTAALGRRGLGRWLGRLRGAGGVDPFAG